MSLDGDDLSSAGHLNNSMDLSVIRQELTLMRVLSATPNELFRRKTIRRLGPDRRNRPDGPTMLGRTVPTPKASGHLASALRLLAASHATNHHEGSNRPSVPYYSRPRTAASKQEENEVVQMAKHTKCVRGGWVYFNEATCTLWKQCKTMQQRDREIALYQRVVAAGVPCPNILKCHGPQHRYTRLHSMFVQVPFLEVEPYKGSLEEALRNTNVDIPTRLRWLRDLTAQVVEIHRAGIVHAMLCPATVVVVGDEHDGTLTPKIADWTSAVVHDVEVLKHLARFTLTAQRAEPALPNELLPLPLPDAVTAFGLPPEAVQHKLKLAASYDVYMLGRMYCSVLYGTLELPSKQSNEKTLEGHTVLCWTETRDVITYMTQRDPRARCQLRLALHHPAFWSLDVKVEFVLLCADFFRLREGTTHRLTDWLQQPNGWQNCTRDWFHALADENAPNTRIFYDFTWGALIELFRDLTYHIKEFKTMTICDGDVRKFQDLFLCQRFPTTIVTLFKWFMCHSADNAVFHTFLRARNGHPDIEGLLRPTSTALAARDTSANQARRSSKISAMGSVHADLMMTLRQLSETQGPIPDDL